VRSFLRSWCWLAFLVAACSTPPVASSTDTSKVILFQDATGGGDSKVGDADATPGKDALPGDIDSHDGAIDSQVDAQDSGATEDVSQPADSSTDPDVGTDTSESDVPKLGCNTPGECDDGDGCTTDDCNAQVCIHVPKPGCCTSDAQCTGIDACWKAQCVGGSCQSTPVPGCCDSGACCDPVSHQVQGAKVACGKTPLQVEYQCDGAAIQQRQAIAGCDGVSADGCSSDVAMAQWSAWKSVSSCGDGATCVPGASSAILPTCQGGSIAECLEDAACDDGNECTTDTCVATNCTHKPAGSGSPCGDLPLDTQYQCSSTSAGGSIQVRKAWATCSSGSCSASAQTWTAWSTVKPCGWTEVCSVPDKSKPGTCIPEPDCKPGSACCDAQGMYAAQGTACGTSTVSTEYKCDGAKGGLMQVRKAVAGCSGSSTYCSSSSSSLSWGAWQAYKQCASNQVCSVDWSSQPGTCDGACTAGSTCCTATGDFAAQATKCGSFSTSTQQKCSGTGKGASILTRKGYPGCAGTSASCSYDDANLAWADWTTSKTCAGTEVCELDSFGYASCQSAVKCTPGSQCCTSDGLYAAKGVQCGTYSTDTEYQCSGTGKGAILQQRKGYDGCSGTSTSCSYSSADTFWGPWATYKTCAANETCEVSSGGSYGSCQDAGVCSPTSTCCTPTGDYAAAGTKCGTWVASSEYKCSDTAKGAKMLKRDAYSGCDASGFCSSSDASLVWGDWTTYKTCGSTQYCKVTSPSYAGTCSTTP
jgi:hypothetical protein